VRSMQDALDWVRRSPFDNGTVEIRPVLAAADYGDKLPADVVARDGALRTRTAVQS
jgi:hypothetical protein